VKVSDFGEIATIALSFSLRVFASSLFNWGIGPAYPARGASGRGNWDPPKYTTCAGWRSWEYPTYSAFWSVFGVTCLGLQRLASSVGFGPTARLGARKSEVGSQRSEVRRLGALPP